MGRFDGKVAVITGAASGFGAQVAVQMAAGGARVVLGDLRDCAETAAHIRAAGGEAATALVDVSDPAQVAALMQLATDSFGGIDILHANAGMVGNGADGLVSILDLDLDFWDRTFAVNVRGAMLCIRAALPSMIARGGGSIVITSSIAGQMGENVRSAYSASKAAVNAITRHVATAFGRQGVRCNSIAPGLMREVPEGAAVDAWGRHVPGRVAAYAEVAPVVLFLASDDARHVTGQVLTADGGFSIHFPNWADGGHVSERRA
ncbi:SDR family NAD(P)-dependent oxidoreductase [Ruixingdingia sedimenti]|uniref:SDR family oxidoreductase n=1 Tax=Ruixingdingia sedimenti TaxID=3073604 RepID=A0ABU1F4E6_9RHOB|nr:SDR family oxidoreductase [Xinfangfangia sp. LG-4]MDR5651727.1 SDR family oxidoreductase [Xinfangfangia sp. LG-4]